MAHAIQMQLDPNGVRALEQALTFAVDEGPKDGPQILTEAAIAFCQAGRNLTPSARKNAKREVQTRRDDTGRQIGVMVLSQHASPHFLPVFGAKTEAEARASKLAVVPRVGTGKDSWFGALRDLGKSGSTSRGVSSSRALGTTFHPMREIRNFLNYLLKIAPNVNEQASGRAAKTLVIKTEKYLNKVGFK